MAKKEKNASLFRIMSVISKLTFKCWPLTFSFYLILGLIYGIMTGAIAWVMQFAFDAVTELAAGSRHIQATIFPVIIFILFMSVQKVIDRVRIYYLNSIGVRMHGFMFKEVSKKSEKLDPILFEHPKMLDDIERASDAAPQAFWTSDLLLTIFIVDLPLIIIMSAYLYTLNPQLIFVMVLSFVPKVIGLAIRGKLYTNLAEKSAPLRREFSFYEEALVDRQYFKETRILGIFDFFKEKLLKSVCLLNRETWKADSRAATFDLVSEILMMLSYLGILYLLFISLQSGFITVGAFAAVFASMNVLHRRLDILISYQLANVIENIGQIGYLVKFFDLPEKISENIEVNWQGDIEFKNVRFTYPNAKKASLNDLSLTIHAGETVAIVGSNGAGKSTFTKLLMGLYEPTSGEIIIAGQNIKGIAPKELYKGVSAVFQQYQRYQLTLEENISISDISEPNNIHSVMEQSGVDSNPRSYPEGLDTMLSREFDGVDLSGGQWQRIAIARGLYRHHDLIVLDEPTAAIDPLEEKNLYEKFAEISKDKTAIIVTHRLGSAQIADKIIVLNDGEIVEIGTHQELLESKGSYAKMYEAQAKWYMV